MVVLSKASPNYKRKLEFAVAHATSKYNAGHLDSNIYIEIGLPLTAITATYLKSKNNTMDCPLKRKMRNRRLQEELYYEAGSYLRDGSTLEAVFSKWKFSTFLLKLLP